MSLAVAASSGSSGSSGSAAAAVTGRALLWLSSGSSSSSSSSGSGCSSSSPASRRSGRPREQRPHQAISLSPTASSTTLSSHRRPSPYAHQHQHQHQHQQRALFHSSLSSRAISATASSSTQDADRARRAQQQPENSAGAGDVPPCPFPFPTHTRSPSPYEIFHLDRTASPAQIKSRYYDLVRIFHPDRALSSSSSKGTKVVEERFKLVVKAYELLSNTARRRTYDRTGLGWNDAGSRAAAWDRSRRGWEHRGDPSSRASGHDRYGWQRYHNSARADDSEYFYGFAARHATADNNNNNGGAGPSPRYLPNGTFFSLLLLATWAVAAFQYNRLAAQASRATARADQVHLDAAHSLKMAREAARGEEGRRRREAVRRRVREMGVLEQVRAMEAEAEARAQGQGQEGAPLLVEPEIRLSEADKKWGIGHGGPSGKEAHLERKRRAEAAAAAVPRGSPPSQPQSLPLPSPPA